MDLGAPVRASSADTGPARGHWCVSEPAACRSFAFESFAASGDDAGEGEGSSDECVSATPLMSFSVITTQWIGLCHEPFVVKRWPVASWPAFGDCQIHYCFVSIQYAGEEAWGIVQILSLLVRIWCMPHAASHEKKPSPLYPEKWIMGPTRNNNIKSLTRNSQCFHQILSTVIC